MLKDKILASLKNKYKNLGLSEQVLEGMAEMLAITTTEEGQIETAVAGVEKLLKGFQSDADKRVTDAVKTAKAEAEKAKPNGGNPEPEKPKGGDNNQPNPAPSDIAKAIQEAMKPLVDKIAALESGKVTESRRQQLETKLKDANPIFASTILEGFEHRTFENDEAFTAYLQGVETKLGEFEKSLAESGMGALGRPPKAGGNSTEASKEEVAAIVNEIM